VEAGNLIAREVGHGLGPDALDMEIARGERVPSLDLRFTI
jgi:hypothetical protein